MCNIKGMGWIFPGLLIERDLVSVDADAWSYHILWLDTYLDAWLKYIVPSPNKHLGFMLHFQNPGIKGSTKIWKQGYLNTTRCKWAGGKGGWGKLSHFGPWNKKSKRWFPYEICNSFKGWPLADREKEDPTWQFLQLNVKSHAMCSCFSQSLCWINCL